MPIRVPFSKSTVFKICRQKMCRFRVNRRPIRHIFCRFQNVPASCERSLKQIHRVSHKEVYQFAGLWNKRCVADVQNENVNLLVEGQLSKVKWLWFGSLVKWLCLRPKSLKKYL